MELPWQREPSRKELARNFDRRKYPFVFEWGRTAQDLPKEAEPLAAMAATLNYQEVLAMGANLAMPSSCFILLMRKTPAPTRFAFPTQFTLRVGQIRTMRFFCSAQ